ncbi:MAG: SCO family protein, partial [Trueperaceae bacterium]
MSDASSERSTPPRSRLFWAAGAFLLVAAGLTAYTTGPPLAPGPALAGTVLENPQEAHDLAFDRAPDGARVTLGEVASEAEWTLVFFGFVDCPDVCPLVMSRLADLMRELERPDAVQVAMVTVDPERDDPERLGRYVTGFHPRFVGLTGENEDVATAAQRFFVGYNQVASGVVHTESVALVDRQGRLRAVYGQGSLSSLQVDLVMILNG